MRCASFRLCRLLLVLASGWFVFESLGCKLSDGSIRITAGEEDRTAFDELEDFFDKVF